MLSTLVLTQCSGLGCSGIASLSRVGACDLSPSANVTDSVIVYIVVIVVVKTAYLELCVFTFLTDAWHV